MKKLPLALQPFVINATMVTTRAAALPSPWNYVSDATSQWRTVGCGFGGQIPFPKFRRPSKIVPNSTLLWNVFNKNAEFKAPTPHDDRGEGGLGGQPPPTFPKFRRPSKIVPNSTRLWNVFKEIAEFKTPKPHDDRGGGLGGQPPHLPKKPKALQNRAKLNPTVKCV